MKAVLGPLVSSVLIFSAWAAPADEEGQKLSLSVPSGAPVRLYLTGKIPKRQGAPVEAKVLEPVFAFDREVIPAGTIAHGQVSRVQSVSKWQRTLAILNGDFTPLRRAEVKFMTLTLPDGRTMDAPTLETEPLNSIYTEPSIKKSKHQRHPGAQNNGILGTAKQTAKDQINGAINARSRGAYDLIRGPNKKEKLIDLFWSKLPYHPQYVRRGTRFDAPLQSPLQFGVRTFQPAELADLGSPPGPDSVARVRLLTALDSSSTKVGETVKAVLTAPLFSPTHKLVLPEGARLSGTVVASKKSRSFHRSGQLRFTFQNIELPDELAKLRPAASPQPVLAARATLNAAEASGPAPIKVDSEGGVQARESKSRFLAPAISLVLASRAADNDAGHNHAGGSGGGDANVSGRTLGGGLGFGMVGSAVSQSSRWVGMAFGYYGLAWSVYSNVIAHGGEVVFDKNAMMDVKFGTRR